MLKRLIEVALPLKEVSEQSAREKSIRHGHISTLHIWWARRPLAACRAVVFASLIPDPDDPECPESFRAMVRELLSRGEFKPKGEANGEPAADTPRNRCLEFIKHLVRWENSNNPEYIEPARKLIAAAHKILHPDADSDAPKVLDPFAGGGAIPLEALRLGCEAHAIDLNPVAHLIELCTLVYPQKYGQPDSRPVPDYIKRLIAHNRAKKTQKDGAGLFDKMDGSVDAEDGEIIPNVEITEAEYRKNPLSADVRYWGHWVLERARQRIGQFYPSESDGSVPVAYLWARTVVCPNPGCKKTIPLFRRPLVSARTGNVVVFGVVFDEGKLTVSLERNPVSSFDVEVGTVRGGSIKCPFCDHSESDRWLQAEGKRKGISDMPLAVVLSQGGRKAYRALRNEEIAWTKGIDVALDRLSTEGGLEAPSEPISDKRPSANSRGLSAVTRYGMTRFKDLFNRRQQLALLEFCFQVRQAANRLEQVVKDDDYQQAIVAYLALAVGRLSDFNSTFCTWSPSGEFLGHTFTRHALGLVWDYAEVNPFSGSTGDWSGSLDWISRVINHCGEILTEPAHVQEGDATRLPLDAGAVDAVLTDPPYYDSVPYADISDYFYVWLKRALGPSAKKTARTPLTPKANEAVMHAGRDGSAEKAKNRYEGMMTQSFCEQHRVLRENGISLVVFAHRTTAAWEALIAALQKSGLIVVSSWPLRTERGSRMIAQDTASLASSIVLICRRRSTAESQGLWNDVRIELQVVAQERLDFFWSQGIRGADFFISAIGPALSVFGKYEGVTKLSGEEVTVGQFLDEVRGLVTSYALEKILHAKHTSTIDAETRFYVVWKWSCADAKVPADEAFKLAQALGMHTEIMWDRTGVLEKSGENVAAVGIEKRKKIKDLGEPSPAGAPASLVDVLHRLCAFREKGDTDGMAEFLARSRQGQNPALWLVAQAISEILPDGDKEKQLMQGLLNQREKLEHEQGRLF